MSRSLAILPFVARLSLATLAIGATLPARAYDFVASTHLIELRQGSTLSDKASSQRRFGYESASGGEISMNRWYATRWVDFHVGFLTRVSQNLGITWGFSTGEKGEKYTIDPSWKLGLVYTPDLGREGHLVFRASQVFSGKLREKSCIADYGEIGGIHEVNCRLAATPLPPEETLAFNFNEKPAHRYLISIEYRRPF